MSTMQLFWWSVTDIFIASLSRKHSRKKKRFSKRVSQREEKQVTNHHVSLICNQTFINIL